MSASQIKVAAIISNINEGGNSLNSTAGSASPEEEQAAYQAVADATNASGGVACRKLVPVYYTVNPADQSNEQQTCLNIAGADIFAVLDTGGMQGELGCFAQHRVPYFGGDSLLFADQVKAYYPYAFSALGIGNRQDNNTVFALAKSGFFSKANGFVKLGFPYFDGGACDGSSNKQVLNDFHRIGLTDAQIVTYDWGCPATPATVAPSDMENAILKFKTAGVTHLVATAVPIGFTQVAQQQGFKPKYGFSDNFRISGAYGVGHDDYDNIAGALAITDSRYGEDKTPGIAKSAATQRCNAILAARKLPDVFQHGGNGGVTCGLFSMFAAAVDNASSISRESLPSGLQRVKSVDLSYPSGPNAFTGSTPTMGGEFWRIAKFESGCTCWRVIDPTFHPSFQPWGPVSYS